MTTNSDLIARAKAETARANELAAAMLKTAEGDSGSVAMMGSAGMVLSILVTFSKSSDISRKEVMSLFDHWAHCTREELVRQLDRIVT